MNNPYERYKNLEKIIQEKNNALHARLEHHPGVKKLVELGGACTDTALVMKEMEAIEQCINKGISYRDAFTRFAYADCFIGNLALLTIAEERFNTNIISAEQWQTLCQIDPEYISWIKASFTMALEARYHIALVKILTDGGCYTDLLMLQPEHFGLPEKWEGMLNTPMTKEDMINRIIYFFIDDFFLSSDLEHVTLQDAANKLKAPDKVIKAAIQHYG